MVSTVHPSPPSPAILELWLPQNLMERTKGNHNSKIAGNSADHRYTMPGVARPPAGRSGSLSVGQRPGEPGTFGSDRRRYAAEPLRVRDRSCRVRDIDGRDPARDRPSAALLV